MGQRLILGAEVREEAAVQRQHVRFLHCARTEPVVVGTHSYIYTRGDSKQTGIYL